MAYIGNTPADGEFKKADAISSTFNGVLTQFNIDYGTIQQSIGDPSQLIVSLNGVIQEPLTAYTLGIGGGSIIFASAPVSGDTCHIVILGGVGGTITPSDNSVTASKLSPSLKDFLEQNFVANGSQTTYTLSRAATGANTLLLSIDGILQPSSAFSVSGTTLTIDPALPNTTNVRVVHLGVVAGVYVPAPDSVTADMIANSINTDIATGVAALPKAGGAMTGPITTNSTFDGVDVGVRDGILTSTTTTANAALPKAGGTMTGVIAGFESTGIDDNATSTAITIDASEIVTVGSTVSPALKVNRQTANGDAYIELQSNGTKVANLVGSSVGGFSVHTGASGTLTTALSIDNAGIVTKPLQPAFGANASYTNIPLSGHVVMNLSERFDVGGNLTSNTFTAPVTGKYLITYHVYFTQVDASHNNLGINITTSNKTYEAWWQPNNLLGGDGIFSVSGSQVCDMDINDTMLYKLYTSGGTAQTDIHGDSTVSGCLIC